jgi:tetratricopeptide (TPR) repeat protein
LVFGRLATSAHWFSALAIKNEPQAFEMILGALFCVGVSWLVLKRPTTILTHWALWTVIMVLPFVNNALDRQIVGPSRQLYLASVGSSVVLAWLICYSCQKLKNIQKQKIALVGLVSVFIVTSLFSLEKAEGIDYWLVGRSYTASRKIDKGLVLYEEAYKHGRDILPINFYTQHAIIAFGTEKKVLSELLYAERIYPEDFHIKALIGVANFISDRSVEQQKGQSQIVSALQATNSKPALIQDLTAALQNSAAYFHQNHHYDRAIQLYELVLKLRPDYVIALINMGRASFAKSLYKKGIDALIRVTELEPESELAWEVLGDMFWEVGDYQDAISAYQNAHILNGQQQNLPYNIGLLYEVLGEIEKATLWYHKVLEINSQHTETIQHLDGLGQ